MIKELQSIRFRLTGYFLAIFIGLIFLIALVILYYYKAHSIERGKISLRDKSFVMGAWVDFANPRFDDQIRSYISSQDAELMIQLYDKQQKRIGKSGVLESSLPLSEKAWKHVAEKDDPYLYESEDGKFVIAVNNLYSNDRIMGFVQLIQSKDSMLTSYYYLVRIILATVFFSMCAAFVAGTFLVSQVLSPINKIINTVTKIKPEQLDPERLEVINANDEIGRLSSTINNLLDRIQHTIVIQRQFTSDAAHELRTPLTIIKGNTEVALMQQGSDHTVLSRNLMEIDHLISLTNDLLFISRFDADTNVMLTHRFNFSEVVIQSIDAFQFKAASRNIRFVSHIEQDIQLLADASLLKRVIYNILDNAIKYGTDEGKVSVSLSPKGSDAFDLTIQDEGIGIPPDKLPFIFERFYRVSEDRNKAVEGTGLGLSIVKSIVELHGYTIEVKSEWKVGTIVSISGKKISA